MWRGKLFFFIRRVEPFFKDKGSRILRINISSGKIGYLLAESAEGWGQPVLQMYLLEGGPAGGIIGDGFSQRPQPLVALLC